MRLVSRELEYLLSETNRIAMYTLHYGPKHSTAQKIMEIDINLNFDILFTRVWFTRIRKMNSWHIETASFRIQSWSDGGWRSSNNLIITVKWKHNKLRRIDNKIATSECFTREFTSRGLGDRKHWDYWEFHCCCRKSIAARVRWKFKARKPRKAVPCHSSFVKAKHQVLFNYTK